MIRISHPDRTWIGIVIGLIVPFIGLGLLLTVYGWLEDAGMASPIGLSNQFRLRTLSVLALALNLIPLTIYNRKYYLHTMRGMIFPTLFYVVCWVIYFSNELF